LGASLAEQRLSARQRVLKPPFLAVLSLFAFCDIKAHENLKAKSRIIS
jgi:hypothetical protein